MIDILQKPWIELALLWTASHAQVSKDQRMAEVRRGKFYDRWISLAHWLRITTSEHAIRYPFFGISIPILVGSLIFLARVDGSQGQVPQRFRTGSQIHWEFFRSSASHWVRGAMQNSSQSFAELEHRSVAAICRH